MDDVIADGPDLIADGRDVTWVLTHGANMAWRYARSVQPALADVEAAVRAANWPLCVEACRNALRAMALCRQVGRGIREVPGRRVELDIRLATDPDPAAEAMRALPWPADCDETQARDAVTTVRQHDETLRRELPFALPVIRTRGAHGPTVRATATVTRWRTERGLGPVDWTLDVP